MSREVAEDGGRDGDVRLTVVEVDRVVTVFPDSGARPFRPEREPRAVVSLVLVRDRCTLRSWLPAGEPAPSSDNIKASKTSFTALEA